MRPSRLDIDIDLKVVGGMLIAVFGRKWLKPSIAQLFIEVSLHLANLAKHSIAMGWPKEGPQLSMRHLLEGGAEQMHASIMQRARGAGGGGSRKRTREERDAPLDQLLQGQDANGKSLRTALRIQRSAIRDIYMKKSYDFSVNLSESPASPSIFPTKPITSLRLMLVVAAAFLFF